MFSLLLFPGDVRIASMARGRSMSFGNLGCLITRLKRGHLRAGRSRQRVYLSSSCCMDFLMVLRTARKGRVNLRWSGALVIPGFLLGTTAVSASRVRFLRSSSVVCKTQKWGSAAWVFLKGKRGGGVAPLINKPVVNFTPAAYIYPNNKPVLARLYPRPQPHQS